MKIPNTLIVLSTITNVLTRRHSCDSGKSIENILYFKDCNHKKKVQESQVLKTPDPTSSPKPDCPFPKMCCTMSCGNECNLGGQSFIGRQMGSVQNLQQYQPMQPNQTPQQPPVQPSVVQKTRQKKSQNLPKGGRRDFGITKDGIKSLISHDDDIRKILKDLVRVTMQKVDLLEAMNKRRHDNSVSSTHISVNSEEDYDTDE